MGNAMYTGIGGVWTICKTYPYYKTNVARGPGSLKAVLEPAGLPGFGMPMLMVGPAGSLLLQVNIAIIE